MARFDEVEEPKSTVGLARKATVQDLEQDREVPGSQEQLGADQVGQPMSRKPCREVKRQAYSTQGFQQGYWVLRKEKIGFLSISYGFSGPRLEV